MDNFKDRITELEAEISRLKVELEKAREKERDTEESGRAILFMLEDLESSHEFLSRAKTEWEATFDGITDPLFIHDKELKIIRANRAYANASSLSFKEIIGKPYFEVFPKMEKPFKICLKALELQEEEEEEEEEFSCPVTNKIFKVRFYPIKDVNGGYLYSIHILEDITEAKKAAEKIKEAESRYHILFEQSPAGVVIYDPETLFPIEFNDQMHNQLGYSREEFSRLRIPDYEVVEIYEEIKAHAEKVLREGQDTFERTHKTKTGNIRNVLISVKLINLSGKVLLYCIIRDITEIKMAEEKIKQEMEITTHLLMIAETTAHITDVDKLMEQIMRCGHEIMKCDVCLSYIYDKEANAFRPAQCYGLSHEMIPIFRTEPLDEKTEFVKKAMEGKETVIKQFGVISSELGVKDKSSYSELPTPDSKLFSWLPDINTIAIIPLIGKTDNLGLIIGMYKTSKEFTDRDRKIMQGISHQVSTALEQASLYTDSINKSMELSHKIETIQVMHEIDKSILSTLEAQEILETTTRLIGKVIPCDRATVVLVDRERQGFIYKAGFGVTIVQKEVFIPFKDSSATEEVVKKRRTEYISDIGKLKGLRPIEERFLKDGFLSHIRIPLIVKGEIDGILTVGSKRPSAFTPEDLSTLEKIASQIGVALENARLVSDLEELFIGTVKSLSSAIDAKSRWTAGHSERVTGYAIKIAKEMGLNGKALKDIELAVLLHDVGKIGTYESILDKPGKLTDEELTIMRQHPAKGAEILASIKQLKDIIPGVKYHHEFYDGTGYPEGLKGDAIPFSARILSVADTVDAMGADRPYRKRKPMDEIIAELKRCSGIQFDTKVVGAFLRVI